MSPSLPAELWERILAQVPVQDMAILFLTQHRRCEAIYRASRHPFIFQKDLLKCLLATGATIPRCFVQYLYQAYSQRQDERRRADADEKFGNNFGWPQRMRASVYIEILHEASKMYGDSLRLTDSPSDGDTVISWTSSPSRRSILEDDIKEIFITGKFALFREELYRGDRSAICMAAARHPELIEILKVNGYEFKEKDQSLVFSSIFQIFKENNVETQKDVDKLYQAVDDIFGRYPHWKVEQLSCETLFRGRGDSYAACLPSTPEEHTMWAENNGIGPVPATIRVIQRLHSEGKILYDLGKHLVEYCKGKSYRHASIFRILYRLFPSLLGQVRENIAASFISVYRVYLPYKFCPIKIKLMQQCLVDMLRELNLAPDKLMDELDGKESSLDLVAICLHTGLFGANKHQSMKQIVSSLLDNALDRLNAGKHIRQVRDIVIEFDKIEGGGDAPDRSLEKQFFLDPLHEILSLWAIDLDILIPDTKTAPKKRFRSQLGWMMEGSVAVKNYHVNVRYKAVKPHDPYSLLPSQARYEHKETARLEFSLTRGQDRIKSFTPEENEPLPDLQITESDPSMAAMEHEQEGWSHFGHLNALTGMIEDFNLDEERIISSSIPPALDETSAQDGMSSLEYAEELSEIDEDEKVSESFLPYPFYPAIVFTVTPIFCASGSECKDHAIESRKVEDVSHVLAEYLDADSPAMRDVLLAHALINGNVELLQKLMSGEYCIEEISNDTAGDASTSDVAGACASRNVQEKKPILPTLAHLRILQKVDRRPLPIFIDCILRGAPFKRGYVMSLLVMRSKEEDIEKRREWYKTKGHRDDRPQMAMFQRKEEQEEQDNDEEALRVATINDASEKDIIDSDTEDEGEDIDGEVTGSELHDVPRVQFEFDDVEYDIKMSELIRRGKSLALWKDHLHLLQWYEKRNEKIRRGEVAEVNKTATVKQKASKTQFSLGLNDMIKKVDAFDAELKKQIAICTEKRRREMGHKKKSVVKEKKAKREDDVATKAGPSRKRKGNVEDDEDADGPLVIAENVIANVVVKKKVRTAKGTKARAS